MSDASTLEALRSFTWRGPHDVIELWPVETAATQALFSGAVRPGQVLGPFDPHHPVIRGWLAFGLIAQADDAVAPAGENDGGESDGGAASTVFEEQVNG